MKNHRLYFVLFASLACFSYPIQAQQGPDDLWEISSIIMMDGMRMPGGPNRV